MANKWINTTVGEFCPFIYGKNLPQGKRITGEIPVFGSNGRVDYHNIAYVKGPGIIIGRKGSVGALNISYTSFWPIDTTFYIEKSSIGELVFTYYLLKTLGLENMNSDSAVPGLNRDNAHSLLIKIPEKIEDRCNIGLWLDTFDKKIFINQEINQTLEQILQTLFKSWFVDFDPVIDNALEAGNPIPDSLQKRAKLRQKVRNSPDFKPLSEEICALFPTEFEETELGWVPKGWNIYTLFEASSFLKRGISPKYIEDGGVQVINQKCIRNHEINFSLCRRNNTELKKVSGYELELGDILINSTGVGTLGRMAQVRFLPENSVVDSHVTVVRANEKICPKYTFGQLLMLQENVIEQLGEGSTGQTELNRKVLFDQKILLPNTSLSKYVEKYILDISEKIAFNSIQIQSLTQLRDTLLPKLISGELSLDDLPETVTETKCA
ncbi:restriction endonuclease subunit S [Xenorhabdus sp. TH1]|uniref:restriction endonuclease subunit S n=1 Tax=Xenorhabdus sp. TH1 TaxID=3130166 RepID=UPI0030CF7005